jgi:hypothetical protein
VFAQRAGTVEQTEELFPKGGVPRMERGYT